jgi:hypothetical protein
MTDIRMSATIAATENEIAMEAEIVIGIESAETEAGTKVAMGIKSWLERLQVIMAVLTGASRVGAEAEVEKMTADTHAATEIARTRLAVEMAIFTEEAAVHAHVLGALIDTTDPEAIAVIEMMWRDRSLEKIDETDDEQVKAQSGKLHLLWLKMNVIVERFSFNS